MNRPAPLHPSASQVWIVRWITEDEGQTRHRIFLREYPARTYYARLRAGGKTVALFTTPTAWVAS
jgi:hypothetical protein